MVTIGSHDRLTINSVRRAEGESSGGVERPYLQTQTQLKYANSTDTPAEWELEGGAWKTDDTKTDSPSDTRNTDMGRGRE